MKPKGKIRKKRATGEAWFQANSLVDDEGDRVVGETKNRP